MGTLKTEQISIWWSFANFEIEGATNACWNKKILLTDQSQKLKIKQILF